MMRFMALFWCSDVFEVVFGNFMISRLGWFLLDRDDYDAAAAADDDDDDDDVDVDVDSDGIEDVEFGS